MKSNSMMLGTLLAATVGTGGFLTPAQAVSPAGAVTVKCASSERTPNLPGKPDVKVVAKTCLKRTLGYNGAAVFHTYVEVTWDGTYSWIGGKRFNSFKVTPLVERRNSSMDPSGSGPVALTSQVNDKEHGSYTTDSSHPYRPGYTASRSQRGGWSADAVITYDIAGDDGGSTTWELKGSPVLR